MTVVFGAARLHGPHIDWAGLSPILAPLGGAAIVLMVGVLPSAFVRRQLVPALSLAILAAGVAATAWQWGSAKSIVSGALRIDDLALTIGLIVMCAAAGAVVLSWRARAPEEAAHGEFYALVLTSAAGMSVLAAAQNTVTLFLGLELLSIPLYILCATELHRPVSLESGIKYLVIGSVGSATLLYGLAMIYGATGSTDFGVIAQAIGTGGVVSDPLLLAGIALVVVGLAFKASVAPFHQWTPDVYEGAPTPVTAFMAVATKAAALGILIRFFDVALVSAQVTWGPALAALATITIVVGNVGALGQSSLKRLLAYSGVAQAGYLLAGVVVSTHAGARATVFYLAVYLFMNIAAFAVVVARERETSLGDDIGAVEGLGASRPWLAWPMTIAMLSLAGIPATAGFVGKLFLIQATVDGGYTWLGLVIVLGSMVSLAYYLRVVAAMWMRPAPGATARRVGAGGPYPAIAGGSPDADGPDIGTAPGDAANVPARTAGHFEVSALAVLAAAATVFFGIVPSPLFDLARAAGNSLGGLF